MLNHIARHMVLMGFGIILLFTVCAVADSSDSLASVDDVNEAVNKVIREEIEGKHQKSMSSDDAASADKGGFATGVTDESGDSSPMASSSFQERQPDPIAKNVEAMKREFEERLAGFKNQMALLREQIAKSPSPGFLHSIKEYEKTEETFYKQNTKPIAVDDTADLKEKKQKDTAVSVDEMAHAYGMTGEQVVYNLIHKASLKALPTVLNEIQTDNLARALQNVDPPAPADKDEISANQDDIERIARTGKHDKVDLRDTATLCIDDAKRLCQASNPFSALSCLSTATGVDAECKQRMREVVFCISYVNPSTSCPIEVGMHKQRASQGNTDSPLSLVNCIKEETSGLRPNEKQQLKDGTYHGKGDKTPFDKYCRLSRYYAFLAAAGREAVTNEIRMELAAQHTD